MNIAGPILRVVLRDCSASIALTDNGPSITIARGPRRMTIGPEAIEATLATLSAATDADVNVVAGRRQMPIPAHDRAPFARAIRLALSLAPIPHDHGAPSP